LFWWRDFGSVGVLVSSELVSGRNGASSREEREYSGAEAMVAGHAVVIYIRSIIIRRTIVSVPRVQGFK
jgi:hypothetical protein